MDHHASARLGTRGPLRSSILSKIGKSVAQNDDMLNEFAPVVSSKSLREKVLDHEEKAPEHTKRTQKRQVPVPIDTATSGSPCAKDGSNASALKSAGPSAKGNLILHRPGPAVKHSQNADHGAGNVSTSPRGKALNQEKKAPELEPVPPPSPEALSPSATSCAPEESRFRHQAAAASRAPAAGPNPASPRAPAPSHGMDSTPQKKYAKRSKNSQVPVPMHTATSGSPSAKNLLASANIIVPRPCPAVKHCQNDEYVAENDNSCAEKTRGKKSPLNTSSRRHLQPNPQVEPIDVQPTVIGGEVEPVPLPSASIPVPTPLQGKYSTLGKKHTQRQEDSPGPVPTDKATSCRPCGDASNASDVKSVGPSASRALVGNDSSCPKRKVKVTVKCGGIAPL